MFGVVEYHVNRLVFQDDFFECDDILLVDFAVQLVFV